MKIKYLIQKEYPTANADSKITVIKPLLKEKEYIIVYDGDSFKGILTLDDLGHAKKGIVADHIKERVKLQQDQQIEDVVNIMTDTQDWILAVFNQNDFLGVVTKNYIDEFLLELKLETDEIVCQQTAALKNSYNQLEQEIVLVQENDDIHQPEKINKRAILDSISDSIVLLNNKLEVLWLNKTASDSVGKSAKDLIGRKCHDLWCSTDKLCKDCPTVKVFQSGQTHYSIIENHDKQIWHKKGEPVLDKSGNPVAVVEISHNITKNKLLEQKLRESEERYRFLVELNPDGIAIHSKGIIQYINSSGINLFGGNNCDQFIGKSILDFIHPEYMGLSQLRITTLLDGNLPQPVFETKILRLDGELIDVEIVSSHFNYQRKPCLMMITRDITDRKRIEKALANVNNELDRLMTSISDCLWSAEIDKNRDISYYYYSPAVEHITGRSPDYFLNGDKVWLSIIHPLDRPKVRETLELVNISTGEHLLEEYRIILPDGAISWVRDSMMVTLLENGSRKLDGVVTDITERKRVEQALKENDQRIRSLLETIPHGVFEINTEGVITMANSSFQKIMGYSSDELLALYLMDVMEAGEIKHNLPMYLRKLVVQEQSVPSPYYTKEITKDGSVIDIQLDWSYKRDDNGQVTGFVCVLADISGLKRAEERIDRLNKSFLNLTPDYNKNINILTKACGELLGGNCAFYNKIDQGMLCSIGQWQPPDDYQTIDEPKGHICMDVLTNKEPDEIPFVVNNLLDSNYAGTDSNVKKYKLQCYIGYPVYCYDKVVGALSVVFQKNKDFDHHEKKILAIIAKGMCLEEERWYAEKALRKSEERYRKLVEFSPDGICVYDGEIVKFVNTAAAKIIGSESPEKMIGRKAMDYLHPDYHQQAKTRIELLQNEGDVSPLTEEKIIKEDGTILDVEVMGTKISFLGEPAIQIFFRDIGDRKRVETELRQYREHLEELVTERTKELKTINEKLRGEIFVRWKIEQELKQSEENFRSLAENAFDAILIGDQNARHVFANKKATELTGYTNEQLLKTTLKELCHPDEYEKVKSNYHKRISGEIVQQQYETKILRMDRSEIPIEIAPAKTSWEGDDANLVFLRDISKRKKAEKALRDSEEQYRNLYDTALVGFFRARVEDGKLLKANNAASKLMGLYSKEDIDQNSIIISDYFSEKRKNELLTFLRDNGEVSDFEAHWIYPDDREQDITISARIYPEKGYIEGVIVDITKRKKAETAREQLEKELHRLNSQIHNSIKNKVESLKYFLAQVKNVLPNSISEAMAYFELIENLVSRLSFASKNILFVLNNKQCTIGKLISELELQAELTFTSLKLAYVFIKDKINLEDILQPEAIQCILDIYTEIISNIVKHSYASNINIQISEADESIILFIKDNGVGFNKEKIHKNSYGIKNMKRLTKQIDGQLHIDTKPNRGTNIKIDIKK